MTQDRGTPFVERLLTQAARRLSAAGLHPLRLRDDIVTAFDASVSSGDAANDVRVYVHPADFARLRPELGPFRDDMQSLLTARAGDRGWAFLTALTVSLAPDPSVPRGSSRVEARFAHPNAATPRSNANATRRLAPIRGLRLVLPGGESIPVAHVPFTIGRAPGNDLVLGSMAISRDHAEITSTPDGVIVRDLGSANGITAGGRRQEQVMLVDGATFGLGDVELYVRFDAQ